MAIKNISSSASNSPSMTNIKDADRSKSAVLTDIGSSNAIKQPSPNLGQANKNYGVELSDKGKSRAAEQKKAYDIAMNTPDIREDKVAELKSKIQAGTYNVDSGKIADGMLREAIMEHLATNKDE